MEANQHTSRRYLTKNVNEELNERLTFGQRVADNISSFGGSWPFIIIFTLALFIWVFYQTLIARNRGFDPYPYILLNLILSCLAAIQAPIIMMSQNRHSQRDRIKADLDYEINLKAELEIEHIQLELDTIREKQDLAVTKSLDEIKSILNAIEQHVKRS